MKKALAIAAALALLLTLTACGNKKGANAPAQAAGVPFDELSFNLWQSLKGVWVCTEAGESENRFIIFGQGEEGLLFTEGLLASDYARTAVLQEASEDGEGKYYLTVRFPAVAETEMAAGMDEHTSVIYLDAASAAEKTITVGFEDGSAAIYDLLGDTLEDASAAVLGGGNSTAAEQQLWSELAGVWANTDGGEYNNYFLQFTLKEGMPFLTVGLFASDYGESGALEILEKLSEGEYKATVFFAAVPASEMYDARAAYSADFIINTAGAAEKTLLVTLPSSSEPVPFDLMGATVEEAANAAGVY